MHNTMLTLSMKNIEMIYSLMFMLSLILTVAYFTLAESKVIASMQCSNGPDKTGIFGLMQPVADAVKLLLKEFMIPQVSNVMLFVCAPVFTLFLSMVCWLFIPLSTSDYLVNSDFSAIWIVAVSSMNVYSIFISGFSSRSKYAVMGSMRAVIQIISYELTMAVMLLPIFFISSSLSLLVIANTQMVIGISNFSMMLPNMLLMFVCILAETNSAPFDLPEAEAELVAGYNVEFSALPFAFFFLGEYLNILTMAFFLSILFLSGWGLFSGFFFLENLFLIMKALTVSFMIMWVRATLPSVRYDVLMNFCWKYGLLFSTGFLMVYISMYSILMFINLVIN